MPRFKVSPWRLLLAVLAGLQAGCGSSEPLQPKPSTLVFRIRGRPPSEEFRYVTSSPGLIAEAQAQLRLPDGQRFLFPAGPIAAGHGGHNQPWQWHFTDLELVELSKELCDGNPTLVEGDLNYWLNTVKSFCPWGGYVYAIVP
jgi:hypothetical protein